jgi:hypothetical protein
MIIFEPFSKPSFVVCWFLVVGCCLFVSVFFGGYVGNDFCCKLVLWMESLIVLYFFACVY